ncbi:MAG: hypothetical protein LPK25_11680 [Cyclobacteriaceae bacterium]|nr:hypothetical protein [Cyclobacteriaceae bacterium]MDX5467224.1 hypothetical protein [Cyclobacteriaceae bacterium]
MKSWLKIIGILWGITYSSGSSPAYFRVKSEHIPFGIAEKITQTCDAFQPSQG